MKIGFVSTWFERGAAYVTRQYSELLKTKGHEVYIYARGEKYAIGDPKWDTTEVTWGKKMYDTMLDISHVSKWIKRNQLECVFFNEQRDTKSVIKIKILFPNVKIGTYIDYYTQDSVEEFKIYDFLICNTKRHFSVFSKYEQCYYIPWGTDIELYNYKSNNISDKIRFFHSAGMSNRKGTDVLIEAFIEGRLYKEAELIIHTQLPLKQLIECKIDDLEKYNIIIVEKTVSAPGLYYMGDIYVYPTTLDGLGLTMYEALASGMPVITTDCAPMNEVITEKVGRLVEVETYRSRWDAYYWPLAFVSKDSLINAMMFYVENKDKLLEYRHIARQTAVEKWDWMSRADMVSEAFVSSYIKENDKCKLKSELSRHSSKERKILGKAIIPFIPQFIQEFIFKNR